MIVGTAGHVDHGKTSLVRALTGVDTDRLKEEKARGITIDLGFAYMPGPDEMTIGFVDVPGHERLVRTMVAGATGIDFALLVIAGDDGPMPQTREHLEILDLLGLSRGLIAITKADRIDAARRRIVTRDILETVEGTSLAGSEMIFVSSVTGEGIDALRGCLRKAATIPARRETGRIFRMGLDRSFTLDGVGTIVTGAVLAGRVHVDAHVTLLPSGRKVRVRSLHAQNKEALQAIAGERCALALTGAGLGKDDVPRGAWICGEADPAQTTRFDAEVRLLSSASQALGQWTPTHLHCGASDVGARITVLTEQQLSPGETGLVQIVIDRPLPLRHGDRFVLRDQSARQTIGGGLVLDPRAPLRKRRSPDRLERLAGLGILDQARSLTHLLRLVPGFEDLTAFAADRGLGESETLALQADLGLVTLKAGRTTFVHTVAHWTETTASVFSLLAAYHAQNPELPGIAGERLRLALAPSLPKQLFAAIRDRLVAEKHIAIQGHWIRLPEHVAQLSADDQKLETLMRPLIAEQKFRPPRVRDIGSQLVVPEPVVRRACKALVRAGAFIELAPDQFFLRETVVEMAHIADDLTKNSPSSRFTAADFRDRVNNGRKVAIQILETFDKQGLTRRDGDLRYVVKAPEMIFGTIERTDPTVRPTQASAR